MPYVSVDGHFQPMPDIEPPKRGTGDKRQEFCAVRVPDWAYTWLLLVAAHNGKTPDDAVGDLIFAEAKRIGLPGLADAAQNLRAEATDDDFSMKTGEPS